MESTPEPRWLTRRMLGAIHADQIRQHGGSPGVRDEGLIQSALARPRHVQAYGEAPGLARLAAGYAVGLARNHGFVDGNKCVAFMALYVFLGLNGQHLVAEEADVTETMLGVACECAIHHARPQLFLAAWGVVVEAGLMPSAPARSRRRVSA